MTDTIQWGLVTCPDHQHKGAIITGSRLEICALRAGCTACWLTVHCTICEFTSWHHQIAGAHQSEAAHTDLCPGRRFHQ